MSFLILFLFGLAVGSFLNVVILRYRPERNLFSFKNLSGRSHCPHCRKKLAWFELVPVFSFLVQGGRCRACQHRLSWQYPLVEILSGLILAGVPFYLSNFYVLTPIPYALITLWVLVFLVWLLISFIDLRLMLIPNGLNAALLIFGLIITILLFLSKDFLSPFNGSFLKEYVFLFSPFPGNVLLNQLLGAGIGVALFGLLFFLSRGRAMGLGDVKLALASGLVLGWPDVGLAIIIAFILGGIFGLIALLFGQKTMKDKIPFGPIFILGGVLTVFLGSQIIGGYFRLFGFY